jgi:hypothetical protein
METIRNIPIEEGVPIIETRGRPTSDEYLTLLLMKPGRSFTSSKSRHTLYQIARNLGIPVEIRSAGEDGWRVFKTGERDMHKVLSRRLKARKRRKKHSSTSLKLASQQPTEVEL